MRTNKKLWNSHDTTRNRQILPGKWWESPNQEAVRIVSCNPPFVRYAQHSYDGAVCRANITHFLAFYKPIDEDRATKILQHPARTTPKVIQL